MDPAFEEIVEAAAVAGWWTVLIAAGWITAAWLVWRVVLKTKPAWLMKLWGFDFSWDEVQKVMLYAITVMKMILFVLVLICIWLSLWT